MTTTTKFSGFSIPDGAYLPPELIYLLPHISGAKVKILIVVLHHNLQIGGGEPISLTDIEQSSGLSRQSVSTAVQELLDEGLLERFPVGQSFAYSPVVKFLDYLGENGQQVVKKLDYLPEVVKKLDQSGQLSESERELINNLNTPEDSLSDSLTTGQKIGLVRELRSAGVYLKTAQDLARRCSLETIRKHLKFYRYALQANLAQGPGWLVSSLKEDWPAPLGYKDPDESEDPRGYRKYTDGPYGDYIER